MPFTRSARRALLALAITAPLAAVAAPAATAHQATAAKPTLAQRLQAIVDHEARGAGKAGVTLQVSDPRHHVAWRGASRMTPGAAFRIASVTKTFTAVVVLRLVEDGRLGLDDTIDRYLDADIVDRVHVLDGVSHGREITVRQLLGHTSGIYDYARDEAWIQDVLAHPQRSWTPRQLIEVGIASGPPAFLPGKGFNYSDTGYTMLGMIVEKVTGRPLAEAYRSMILAPLGMRDTYLEHWEKPRPGAPRRTHQYLGDVDTTNFNPTFDTFGGGGIVSTSGDLTRFIRALGHGRLFHHAATTKLMRQVGPSGDYGLGLDVTERGGAIVIGHDGFFGAFAYYWPERGISITGSINHYDPRTTFVADVVQVLRKA